MTAPSPEFLLGFAAGVIVTALAMWRVIQSSWDRERKQHELRATEIKGYEAEIRGAEVRAAISTERVNALGIEEGP